jgi:hypothetical protein
MGVNCRPEGTRFSVLQVYALIHSLLLFARIWPHVTNTTNFRIWAPNSKQRYLDNERSNRQTAMLYFIGSLTRRAPACFYTIYLPVRGFPFFPSLATNCNQNSDISTTSDPNDKMRCSTSSPHSRAGHLSLLTW